MKQLYDKNRIPIETGDVLKVFHFIGSRNKKHYMYKVAGINNFNMMRGYDASDLIMEKESPHNYSLDHNADKNGVLADTEIVDCHNCNVFDQRKKLK